VVAVAVKLVGATLGDGVDQTTSGLAELGLKAGAGDLKFTNHVLAELKGNGAANLLSEKGVVVVAAIDRVVVEVSCDAIKADHAEVAVGGGARGEQGKVGEAASVEGKGFDALLADDSGEGRLSSIDERGYSAHRD